MEITNPLLHTFAIALGINIVMFIPAFVWKTDKLTDISYAVTFVVVALYGLLQTDLSSTYIVLFSMVLLWAIRLGSYLLIRIHKMGKDKRFDERRNSFTRFLAFWLLQGFTVWLVMTSSSLFFYSSPQTFETLGVIGVLVWATGLLIETVADIQKFRFINNPANKGNWIDSGLWKYSRHPNYFGEILLWLGVYIYTLNALEGWAALIGIVSPLFIAIMIIFVSGIPILEKAADKRWGEKSAYREYKRRTNILLLMPRRK